MSTFNLDDLIGGVERCEKAGLTILNVATNQKDYVPAESYDIKTLAKRITEQLNLRISDFSGTDGLTITDVSIDLTGVRVTYIEDGATLVKVFDDIVQVAPYSIDSMKVNQYGELEVTANDTVEIKGVIVADDANKVNGIEVNADGTITITNTDGSTSIVGNIDNFSEDPVTDTFVQDGDLYMVRNNTPIRVGQIRGQEGVAGLEVASVSIEKVSSTYYLAATLSSGYMFSLGALPEEFYSPNEDIPLGATIDDEGNISFILYNGVVVEAGNVNASNSELNGADAVTVAAYEFRNGGTELYFRLTDTEDFTLVGVPQQITIKATTKVTDIKVTENSYIVFTLDIDGDGLNIVDVNMGKVRIDGVDGNGMASITLNDNQDLVMTYRLDGEVKTKVIGNTKYNRPKAITKNPFGFIEISHDDKTVVTSDVDVNAKNGKAGLFVSGVTTDPLNEHMASLEFSDGSVIADLGKLRPLQTHNVAVVAGEIIFTLADGSSVPLGRVEGAAGRNITNVSLVGNEILVEYESLDVEVVTGTIHKLASIELDEVTNTLNFAYDDLAVLDFEYTVYDGKHATWITAMEIVGGELVITKSDESTQNMGRVDGDWIVSLAKSGKDLVATWNTPDTITTVGTIPDYDGIDTKYIIDMKKDDNGDLVVTWNDNAEEVVGRSDGRWITDLYREGDDFYAVFNNNVEPYLIGSIPSFDGDAPRWIVSMTKDENEDLIVTYNDESFENLGAVNGKDGVWITEITNVEDEFTFTMNDNTTLVRTLTGYTGINGDWVTGMTITPERELVISFHLQDDVNLGAIDGLHYFNGVNSIEMIDGALTFLNRVDGVDQEIALTLTPVDQITDVVVEDTNLIATTHTDVIDAGRVAGDDVVDGLHITGTYIKDGKLLTKLSDESELDAGFIDSDDIASAELVKKLPEDEAFSDLVLTMDSGVTYKFENIVGLPDNEETVDAYIDQQDRLVFTRAMLVPLVVGQVVGDLGIGVDKFSIDELGFLHVHLKDTPSTKIQVAYVMRSFGFKPWTIGSTFNQGSTAVFESNAYVCLSDGTTSAPSKTNPDWLRIRFVGEAGPEVAKPKCISPVGEYVGVRPILNAGPVRNYFSVDKGVKRRWELDTVEGGFTTPLYSAEELLPTHQVEMDLTVGVEYVYRVQDFINTGSFSDWGYSEPFTVIEGTMGTPTTTIETGGDVLLVNGTTGVDSSAYDGTGTHTSSVWQVKTFKDDSIVYENESSTDLLSHVIPFGYMNENTEHGIRVRHINESGDMSSWSDWLVVKTLPVLSWTMKPTIEYNDTMGSASSTPARPRFVVTNPTPEFHKGFMNSKGLQSVWEIEVSDGLGGWINATTVTSMVDITEFRALEVLENAKLHRVRLQLKSSRFSNDSEWSDWLEFTTDYSISAPVISYTSDNIDVDSGFPILDMSGVVGVNSGIYKNDEARYYKWILSDVDSGDIIETYHDYEMSSKIGLIYDGVCNISCVVVGKYSESEESNKISIKLNTATGFIGEVPASELFTGKELSGLIGLSQGTNINSNEPWLKFIIDGEIIYVAKKHYKHTVPWHDINGVNAVYDRETSKVVSKDGNDYRVTLMRGANTDPISGSGTGRYDESEWDRLIYKVHVDDPEGTPWASYTDTELDIKSSTWCQEHYGSTYRVTRGGSSLVVFDGGRPETVDVAKWRPVLRLINPSS